MPAKLYRNYYLVADTINTAYTTDPVTRELVPTAASTLSKAPKSIAFAPPFSIDFQVTRNNQASVNTATITLSNLNLATRKLLVKDDYQTNVYRAIELYAGYGQNLPVALTKTADGSTPVTGGQPFPWIFKGNIFRAYSYRVGVDFLTRIEAQDAGFALLNADVVCNYGTGVSYNQIIRDVINSMRPTITVGAIGNFPQVTDAAGFSFSGPPQEALSILTGGRFFIDGERAYCFQDNEFLAIGTPTISEKNGILGVPVKAVGFVNVELLFEPSLVIFQQIQLQTKTVPYYNGLYKIQGIKHSGMISPTTCGTLTTTLTLQEITPDGVPVSPQ